SWVLQISLPYTAQGDLNSFCQNENCWRGIAILDLMSYYIHNGNILSNNNYAKPPIIIKNLSESIPPVKPISLFLKKIL
ncbi:hypothetical protein, partial [Laspinema palackyanum]|uniref:hypothetical protein n=1 Tax=Laspinema palackyanum TaxID=3231601 RepID=UPI00345CE3D8|nr:hypothetical protein [Laspinema sp. D2c]